MADDTPSTTRRTVLGSLAALGVLGSTTAGTAGRPETHGHEAAAPSQTTAVNSHHPGHPLVVTVGENLFNSAFVGPELISPRENIAPRIPSPRRNPENYDAEDFTWSVASRPPGSEAEVTFATSLFEDRSRYDEGRDNVAEFEADEPGRYVLELEAPDGTHELTIRAFPEPPARAGGPPRLTLDASVEDDEFVVEADARLAATSNASPEDLTIEYFPDDRDDLDETAIESEEDGRVARIDPASLDGEPAWLHAVAYDGERPSVLDTVVLDPAGLVERPNRPPEWMDDAVMYQIFPRSWAGERFATDFDVLIHGDEELGARGVDYLAELGVDVVWLTPVVPSVSSIRQRDGDLVGGGPHGYDTTDYFDVAPDLSPEGTEPLEAYRAFIDACHEHDIKVVFDLVINHCGRSIDLFQDTVADQAEDVDYWPKIHEWDEDSPSFDWFDRLEEPREASPDNLHYDTGEEIEPTPRPTGFWGLQVMPNFNLDNVAVREYMLAVADFWSGEVGVDGFRCDIAWGVPHSMWREIREVVRANDSEFLMLDETIPNDPKMAENQFDMHFDTDGFTVAAHAVARGEADGQELLTPILERADEGFPEHSLFLNAVENHDEFRTLNEALGGTRDDPEKAQRAVWAAGVTLPGVPHVYYGQERAISVYGEGRHRGEDDHRTGDVHAGGKQRAFMNWEEYDADHLGFYRDLIATYHELDVLHPEVPVRRAWHTSMDDVLVFARDARDLDGEYDPELAIVIVNFEPGTATVYLRPEVDPIDHVTGDDLETDAMTEALAIAVRDVAVLEAPSVLSIGDRIADFDVDTGTDDGPGEYVYPTGEGYPAGAFDIAEFSVHETAEHYQFRMAVDGPLENPYNREHGFSVQHLQVYLHDPESDERSTESREGVNATLERPHGLRVVVDGENGTRVESVDGDVVASGETHVNPITDAVIAEVPKGAIEGDLNDLWIAPILLGYDPNEPGNVIPVNEESGPDHFGGGRDDDANPNVIDLVVPFDLAREDALSYTADEPATVPSVELVTPFEPYVEYEVETETDYGPGTYEYPTGDAYYEGAWDLESLEIEQSRERVRFIFTMRDDIENPWDLPYGFSHPFFQVYVHVPDTDGPASAIGRTGTNLVFEASYHYRVVANGELDQRVEDAAGDGVTGDVSVGVDGRSVIVDVPRDAVEWDPGDGGIAIAPVVCPFDGFGDGHLRAIESESAEHVIGGGHDAPIDPKAMDMVVPHDLERDEVLADYNEDTPPTLPYVTLGPLTREELTGKDDDDRDDDEDDKGDDDDRDGENGDDDTPLDDDSTQVDPGDATDDDDSIPGFEALAALAGVSSAALAARRLSDREGRPTDG